MAIGPDFIGVIGDSLTRQNGLGESEITNLLVAKGWAASQVRVSGVVSRTIVDGTATPTTEQTWADWVADGFDPRVVVLNLGANNHNQTESQWATAFDQLLAAIGSLASREVYVFNLAFADPDHANTARFHTWLATYAVTNSLNVIDWWQFCQDRDAASLPIDWKPDDASGRHMLNSANGYTLANTLLANTVEPEAPTTPPPAEDRAAVVFSESFATGTAGSTILVAETAFNSPFSGTSPAHVRSTDTPYGRGFSAHTITSSTSFRRMDHTSGSYPEGCALAYVKLTSLPTGAGSSMVMTRNQGATPASGLRIDSSAFARLQDNTLQDATSSPTTCPTGAWYAIEARWRADTDVHQMRVWDVATRTVLWTSAEVALTAFTTIEDVFFGHNSAAGVWEYRFTYAEVSNEYKWIGLVEQWADATVAVPVDFVAEAHLVAAASDHVLEGAAASVTFTSGDATLGLVLVGAASSTTSTAADDAALGLALAGAAASVTDATATLDIDGQPTEWPLSGTATSATATTGMLTLGSDEPPPEVRYLESLPAPRPLVSVADTRAMTSTPDARTLTSLED